MLQWYKRGTAYIKSTNLFTNIYEIVYLQMIKYLKITYLLLTILSIKSLL